MVCQKNNKTDDRYILAHISVSMQINVLLDLDSQSSHPPLPSPRRECQPRGRVHRGGVRALRRLHPPPGLRGHQGGAAAEVGAGGRRRDAHFLGAHAGPEECKQLQENVWVDELTEVNGWLWMNR